MVWMKAKVMNSAFNIIETKYFNISQICVISKEKNCFRVWIGDSDFLCTKIEFMLVDEMTELD